MARNDTKAFSADFLDQLLAGRDPRTVLDSDGLIGDLKKGKRPVRAVLTT